MNGGETFPGICHRYLWHLPQTSLAYAADIFGICRRYLWHLPQNARPAGRQRKKAVQGCAGFGRTLLCSVFCLWCQGGDNPRPYGDTGSQVALPLKGEPERVCPSLLVRAGGLCLFLSRKEGSPKMSCPLFRDVSGEYYYETLNRPVLAFNDNLIFVRTEV